MSDPLWQSLARLRLIPVIRLDRVADAKPLANALRRGGLPCAEITFRTPVAASALRTMAQEADLLVGAGTVLREEQVAEAADNGAQFVVTPGCNPRIIEACLKRNLAVIPGVCTPTDIEVAQGWDLSTLKFFPAEAFGGCATLRALHGPYPHLRFIPTGGIRPENICEYLQLPFVMACGGSWMVPPRLLDAGDFEAIASLIGEAVQLIQEP